MAKFYGGEVTITIHAHDIECDGSLWGFASELFPSWEGEMLGVDGDITLEYEDDVKGE